MPDFIDLTGQKFGKLTAINRAPDKIGPKGYHETYWNCVCDCGNTCQRSSRGLRNGISLSCGCLRKEKTQTRLLGQKFGYLTVIAFDHQIKGENHAVYWKCKCDCGNETVVDGHNLVRGTTIACGKCKIWLKDRDSFSRERLYSVWKGMLRRCTNETDKAYHNYGGRGISVCDEWLNNYPNFREWALSSGYDKDAPADECTLDRIDVNGNYCPENCRWVDMKTQSRNKRVNVYATLNGETRCIKDWCETLGVSLGGVWDRIYAGWKPEKALTEPIEPIKKIKVRNKELTISEWSHLTGLTARSIYARLRSGMSPEEAILTPPRYKNGARGRKYTPPFPTTERSETAQMADLLD